MVSYLTFFFSRPLFPSLRFHHLTATSRCFKNCFSHNWGRVSSVSGGNNRIHCYDELKRANTEKNRDRMSSGRGFIARHFHLNESSVSVIES